MHFKPSKVEEVDLELRWSESKRDVFDVNLQEMSPREFVFVSHDLSSKSSL